MGQGCLYVGKPLNRGALLNRRKRKHEGNNLDEFEKIGGKRVCERETRQSSYMPALLFAAEHLLLLSAGALLLLLLPVCRTRQSAAARLQG